MSVVVSITQLSVVIPPPAPRLTVVENGAGVVSFSGDRNSRAARAEVNRRG